MAFGGAVRRVFRAGNAASMPPVRWLRLAARGFIPDRSGAAVEPGAGLRPAVSNGAGGNRVDPADTGSGGRVVAPREGSGITKK
jgi:hypothetical protein